MRQFIGRQELTEKKRSEFEVDAWLRSNSYLFIIRMGEQIRRIYEPV